ncbi:MAG: cytochrome P450 [Bacteroidia bacterium]|nr:cytochrome P450 [Bacteroidia bacterium]MCF8427061.1 cytochrome P450 [Bacteroidia bacterium]MCF8446455.1 cytochrome P450 [Bacteroidia bacterium]
MELDLTGFEFSQNPYAVYEELRKTGQVHYFSKTNSWLIIGYSEIQEILGNFELYSSEGSNSFDPILLNCDPPAHTRHKKVLISENGILAPNRIDKLEAQNREICKSLIRNLKNKNSFDLLVDFAMPFSTLVILNLLGIKPDSTNELKKWSEGAVLSKSIYNTEFAIQQWNELKPIVQGWIEEAKNQGSNFGIASLFLNEEAKSWDTESLLNLIKVLLLGGNETTPNLVSSALLLLLKNSELQKQIGLNQTLIQDFLFETLRIEAPTQIIQRVNKSEIILEGKVIPAHSTIGLAIGAGNRDPRIFKDPNTFNLNREKGKILSFGYGPHYCIGATLAKQEAQIAFEELLTAFPSLGLSNNFKPKYRHSSHVRGLSSMELFANKESLDNLNSLRQNAFNLLETTLKEKAHFPTYENYPNLDKNTWHYTFPSPFIHANVLYSLVKSKETKAISLVQTGKEFLVRTKEKNDIWRFWKLDNCRNPVPPDLDDTAICSFILRYLKEPVDNTDLFLENIQENGSLKTWLMPSPKMLFKNPSLAFELFKQKSLIKPTLQAKMLHELDGELGVMANAMMYLGQSVQTEPLINYCITNWQTRNDNKHFYDNDLVVAYHISRAYQEGVKKFAVLRESVLNCIPSITDQTKTPEILLSFLIANYFEDPDFCKRIKSVLLDRINLNKLQFENFRYFTSKDRNFYGGSECLTAAWFLEVTENW